MTPIDGSHQTETSLTETSQTETQRRESLLDRGDLLFGYVTIPSVVALFPLGFWIKDSGQSDFLFYLATAMVLVANCVLHGIAEMRGAAAKQRHSETLDAAVSTHPIFVDPSVLNDLATRVCADSRHHTAGGGEHDASTWGPCSDHARIVAETVTTLRSMGTLSPTAGRRS